MLRQYLGGNRKTQVTRALSISESGFCHYSMKLRALGKGILGWLQRWVGGVRAIASPPQTLAGLGKGYRWGPTDY